MPSPLTHRLLHTVRHKTASKRSRQSAAGDAYVVGGYRDDKWNPDCPVHAIRAVAALMYLLGDVFDGERQRDDPASVPLLTPHTRGGLSPPPLWVVCGRPAYDRACKAMWGREEWAIVVLLLSGPALDADESPVPEVVRLDKAPHDPPVAVTSLRDSGAVKQGIVVVFQLPRSTAVWGAQYTTVLDAIKSICGGGCALAAACYVSAECCSFTGVDGVQCGVTGEGREEPPFGRSVAGAPPVVLGARGGEGHVVQCLSPPKTGPQTWQGRVMVLPRGQSPSAARSRRRRSMGWQRTCSTPPLSGHAVHVVDASIIGVHLRRA